MKGTKPSERFSEMISNKLSMIQNWVNNEIYNNACYRFEFCPEVFFLSHNFSVFKLYVSPYHLMMALVTDYVELYFENHMNWFVELGMVGRVPYHVHLRRIDFL